MLPLRQTLSGFGGRVPFRDIGLLCVFTKPIPVKGILKPVSRSLFGKRNPFRRVDTRRPHQAGTDGSSTHGPWLVAALAEIQAGNLTWWPGAAFAGDSWVFTRDSWVFTVSVEWTDE